MTGHPYEAQALGTLVALVNSAPPASEVDELATLDGIRGFISRRVITEVARLTREDIPALAQVRARLRSIAEAEDEAVRCGLVNAALEASVIRPRLADHDGLGLHLHFFPRSATVADHLMADCGMAVAELMVAGEGPRLKRCAALDCGQVFIDRTRNRSRAYCDSRRCGNRLHAAAYRERRRTAGTASEEVS